MHEQIQGAEDRPRYLCDIVLPLRERIIRDTLLQYNAMQLGVFELLRARERQIEAARAYVGTPLGYWLARTNLEQLLRGRLPRAEDVIMGRGAVRGLHLDGRDVHHHQGSGPFTRL
jgi:hypothetical protein